MVDETIDAWGIINRLFLGDVPLAKSQYFDLIKPNKALDPDTSLWLNIFKLTAEDWLRHKYFPTKETARIVREIESWVYKDSLAMNMMAEALDIAFGMNPDFFKKKFRRWLRQEKLKPIKTIEAFIILEPFESFSVVSEPIFI